jgi:hypothetical protein
VGKDEGEVAALGSEQCERLLGAIPAGTYMGLKPAAELESVKLSLIEEQTQKFFPIHLSRPLDWLRVQG